MAINDFSVEMDPNYEEKILCVFVLDVSDSMHGKPMDELNKSLQDFYSVISDDVTFGRKLEISFITFNHEVRIIQEPALVENFTMPHLSATDFSSEAMENAVNMAINLVEHRKEWYRMTEQPYYCPLIILISSVEYISEDSIDSLSKRIKSDTTNRRYSFMPFGFDISNMAILDKIRGNFPPMILRGTELNIVARHVESLLDGDIPLSRIYGEQNELVDFSDLDWAHNFSI